MQELPTINNRELPLSEETAQELLTIYGSPLYVYQGDRLRQTIANITQAIPYPRTQLQFASVTNGNVALLQIFHSSGWGLHANTPGDIYLGLQAGFSPNQIVYSGSNLNRVEMEQLLNWGVTTLNLDSLSQLQLFCNIGAIHQLPLYFTDVCGNTTYSRDYLGRNCQLPPLQIGDILAVLDVGAYGYAMSSHFLHRPRPAEILLEKEQHRLIRQREDFNVLLTHQYFN